MIYQIKPVIGASAKQKLIQYLKKDNWLTEYKYTLEFEKRFAKFTNERLEIAFDYDTLSKSDPEIVNKIMHGIEKDTAIDPFSDSSTNLFRGDVIFKLFPNLHTINIHHGGYDTSYKFSFSYLLSMISKKYSLQTITIKGRWIKYLWFESKDRLISMFNQHQFDIKYEYNEYSSNRKVIISRE